MHPQMNRQVVLLSLFFLATVLAAPLQAQQPKKTQLVQRAKSLRMSADPINPEETILDINNMTTWVRKDGYFHWSDPFSGVNGTLPKGTAGSVFSQGIVWGGVVHDGKERRVRVNGNTYSTGLQAGKIVEEGGNLVPDNPDNYHVWRVHRNWETMDYTAAAAQFYGKQLADVTDADRQAVREQYEHDWNTWPADKGAPFEDVNGNGIYDPDADIPGHPGADQTLWLVANDLDPEISQGLYGSPPIGLEYQLTIWGYDFPATSPLGNMHFARARLIYKGTNDAPSDAYVDSMYVSQWVDPDVGSAGDDFAGSDTTLSLGYAYNANTRDNVYENFGVAPPAIGWDFLQGPVNAQGDTLGMTSYVYFAAGSDISDPDLSDYNGTLQWFNLMRGMRPRPEYPAGEPFINPLTGESSKFTLTGDPVAGTGWIDGMQLPPGDRRIVLTSGPFQMQLGDTVDVVLGQVGAVGSSNLSSVTVLKYYDQFAQFAYNNNFDLPSPPSVPPVNVAEGDEKVVLDWGSNLNEVNRVESSGSQGFQFEGYNVYQLPSPNSSTSDGVKVATFDKENLVSTIFDQVIDEETGFVIEKPVQTAPNEGIQRYLEITRDHIRNRPIANGVKYHYAITTYSYLADEEVEAPFRRLESSPVVVTAVPQPPKPGVTNVSEFGEMLSVEQTNGSGDATVQPKVVNPEQLVDASWTVTFDTTGGASWNLQKDGEQVLSDQSFGMLTDIPLVNGLQVNVSGVAFSAPTSILEHSAVEDEGDDLSLWGDATLFGLPNGYYTTFTGAPNPTVEEAKADLEFRFTGNGAMEEPTTEGGQLATYWERAAFGADDSLSIKYESKTIRMPFELWDVENNRQVNFAIIGRNADDSSPWGDGAGDYYRMSARDYIVPIMSEYNEAEVEANGTSPADPKATWLLFFKQGGASQWETGDVYRVRFANPVEPGTDQFAFNTSAAMAGVEDSLRADVKEINVFPNPYVGYSRLETTRQQKFVTFTHLPEKATIRIFSIDGTMVRRIEHNGDTQFEEWDLTNQDDIPVASGVYVVHVETEYGDKVLKVALVQEEQILERY